MRETGTGSARGMLAAAAAAVGLAAAVALAPTVFVPCDFVAFWSSAVVFDAGGDAYDPALLLPLENAAGFDTDRAVVMFNPPWVLPVLAPFGGLPVRLAFAVWMGLQLGLVLAAAGLLWRAAGGAADRAWLAAVLTVGFTPTYILLVGGQLTGLALVGLAGFAYFRRNGRPAVAGAFAALTAVKPHLLGLFAVALLIDAARSQAGRRVVLAGAAALAAVSAVAVAVRPAAFADYRAALAAPGTDTRKALTDYPAPVVGVKLREALPGQPGWVAFVPFAVAAAGLVACRRWLPPADRWAESLPLLVAGSLVVAPYGGWWYDMILLLPLVLLAAVRLDRAGNRGLAWIGVAGFAAASLAIQVLYTHRDQLTPLFAIVPPVVAAGCLSLVRAVGRPVPVPAPVGA